MKPRRTTVETNLCFFLDLLCPFARTTLRSVLGRKDTDNEDGCTVRRWTRSHFAEERVCQENRDLNASSRPLLSLNDSSPNIFIRLLTIPTPRLVCATRFEYSVFPIGNTEIKVCGLVCDRDRSRLESVIAGVFVVFFRFDHPKISTIEEEEEEEEEETFSLPPRRDPSPWNRSLLPDRGKKALKSLINRAWRQTGDRCTATMHRSGCAARSRNSGANVVSCKRADPALGHPSLPITYRGRWHC